MIFKYGKMILILPTITIDSIDALRDDLTRDESDCMAANLYCCFLLNQEDDDDFEFDNDPCCSLSEGDDPRD